MVNFFSAGVSLCNSRNHNSSAALTLNAILWSDRYDFTVRAIFVSIVSAPHCSSQRLRPGHRAAAGGRSSHGPERFRRMAGAPRRGVLGSGTGIKRGCRKRMGSEDILVILLLPLLFQMHVAELLVSHGASLNAKTFLEETPIGVLITDLSIELTGVRNSKCWPQQGLFSSLCEYRF